MIYYRLERAQVGTPTRTVTYRKYRCKHLKSMCIAARRLESLNMYMNVLKIEYLCEKLIYYRTERAQVGLGLSLTLTLISVRVQKATTKIVWRSIMSFCYFITILIFYVEVVSCLYHLILY